MSQWYQALSALIPIYPKKTLPICRSIRPWYRALSVLIPRCLFGTPNLSSPLSFLQWYWLTIITLFLRRNADGFTPFMLAVCRRAYPFALFLFDVAKEFATNPETTVVNQDHLMSMICPSDTSAMSSPLYLLCCNDTCSFTWTGTRHIRQNIFECRTCGLTGTLCCCTECARVCHRGHDCKYAIFCSFIKRQLFLIRCNSRRKPKLN